MAMSTTKEINKISNNKCFGGNLFKYEHTSTELQCNMKYNVFLPKEANETSKVPAILFLSGLTCNEDNFMQKSGALAEAAKHSFAIITCDTSPRGVSIEGDNDSWDFGTGAGFYVDATETKWKKHYRMYSYVVEELYSLILETLPIDKSRISIMGHSMGGHGALVIFLRNRDKFRTVSAFSPVANPINCPWGQKAFQNYLGPNEEAWKAYDTVELLKESHDDMDVLVDVGTADAFLEHQLKIENLEAASSEKWKIRRQEGYDHSYYFISTFISDHIQHHVRAFSK